jgi:hypothetical protein
MIGAMRRALLSTVLALVGCPEDEPDGNPRCDECEQADACPDIQPTINPLVACEEQDAECFYCGAVRRRFVCADDGMGGALMWRDRGEADMCPPPSEDTGATG